MFPGSPAYLTRDSLSLSIYLPLSFIFEHKNFSQATKAENGVKLSSVALIGGVSSQHFPPLTLNQLSLKPSSAPPFRFQRPRNEPVLLRRTKALLSLTPWAGLGFEKQLVWRGSTQFSIE